MFCFEALSGPDITQLLYPSVCVLYVYVKGWGAAYKNPCEDGNKGFHDGQNLYDLKVIWASYLKIDGKLWGFTKLHRHLVTHSSLLR